jgi:prepilin-type N-terminal cleavage/methylation domain-containing protein
MEKDRSRELQRNPGLPIESFGQLNPENCSPGMVCKPGKGRGSRGFTLLETLMSLPLMAIAFAALYSCFGWGFGIVGLERENLRASQIMIKQLERIRISSYDLLTNTVYNPSTFTDYFDPTDQSSGGGGSTYTGSFTASLPASGTLPDSYRTNMLLITVGITWHSYNHQHTNWMQSLVAMNGMETYVVAGK